MSRFLILPFLLILTFACGTEAGSNAEPPEMYAAAGEDGLGAGQTGGEVAANTAGAGCLEEIQLLASLDETTALGVSPAQVLKNAKGEQSAPLQWHQVSGFTLSRGEIPVDVSPESGVTEITMVIEHSGGELRYIRSTPDPDAPGNVPRNCQDRLEVDVNLQVTTSGQALNEDFTSTLTAISPFLTRLSQSFELEELSGELSISAPQAENAEYVQMSIIADFGPDGYFAGTIGGVMFQNNGLVASAGGLALASWE